MTPLISLIASAFAVLAAGVTGAIARKRGPLPPWIFIFLTFVLPFATGGFHTYLASITTALLLANLISLAGKNGSLCLCLNRNTAAVLLVALAYCVTPIWAADKGMALFGIIRCIPLLLLSVTLMQYSPLQQQQALSFLPLCGAWMTLVSLLFLFIPGLSEYVTVNGRLSGLFQYPNTFAVFLLAGLILCGTSPTPKTADLITGAILVFGVILSGSRTAFVLLAAVLAGIAVIRRQLRAVLPLVLAAVCGAVLAVAAADLGLLSNADRFTSISTTAGTFLVRLLYYKDALPVILAHPFGLGYLGYRALEGTFQTGRYAVTYVHNGLLQLLLDIGWIPALFLAAVFLLALFSKKTSAPGRLLLLTVLAHCVLDFDLQFFTIWVILLCQLDHSGGKQVRLRSGKAAVAAICAPLLAVSIWLGAGDLCFNLGLIDASLAVTPFHTDALTFSMLNASDPADAAADADRVLALNPTNSAAYRVKSNYAFSAGEISSMIEYAQNAISCSRYDTAEYCGYFDKLYMAAQLYAQAGDTTSAAYCRTLLLEIPALMESVAAGTDPLAYLTGDDPSLVLPDEYLATLEAISADP